MNRPIIGVVLGVVVTAVVGCATSSQPNFIPPRSSTENPSISGPQGFMLSMRNRPATVPLGFVATPDGWFHPSCIIELREGDRLNGNATIELATGGHRTVAACAYPSYTPSGRVRSSIKSQPIFNNVLPEPNGWQVSETSFPGNIGKLSANWSVPFNPTTETPEVDYYFPGLENSGSTTYIAQPVLAWGYGGVGWTIASWFCCINGNISHGQIVNVIPLQSITGAVTGSSCNSSTGICADWNVNTASSSGSSGFSITAFNEPMIYEVGGALESYYVSACAQYSTDANILYNNVTAYDVSGALLTPSWSENIDPGATCDESGSTSGTSSVNVALRWWPANVTRPASPTVCSRLLENQGLASSGQVPGTTVTSCNGTYKLVMQSDGNLVEYQGSRGIWSTGTHGTSAYVVIMQNDGNFVLYDPLANEKWQTGTEGNPGAHFSVQNDGNLVVYSASGTVLWHK